MTWKNAALGVLAAILIGAVGSGIWDIVAKPSLSSLGRGFLGLLTFGSETVKDRAYASAALNPTATPSLILFVTLVAFPMSLLITLASLFWLKTRRFLRLLFDSIAIRKDKSENADDQTQEQNEKSKNLGIAFFGFSFIYCVFLFVAMLIVSQSILIWRVFNANIAICAPFLTHEEEEKYRAMFAAIKTRNEYQAIDMQLENIAAQNGIELRGETLW